jgi:hypothetical protein
LNLKGLDDSISLSSVNELKVFALDDALAQKFDLKSDVDYVFLNSLFINEIILQSIKEFSLIGAFSLF